MDDVKIEKFSFWQPVVFEDKRPNNDHFADSLWQLGSWADRFAYFGTSELVVNPEQLNIRKYSFETNHAVEIPRITAAKVALCALTLFVLPLAALVIKAIFKWKLNQIVMVKENPNTFLTGKEFGKTRVVIVTGDLLAETTQAVVNAANAGLVAGSGVCGAFQANAGDGIFDECEEILKKRKATAINTGEAVLTTAGDLAPRITAIVHAVGPIYDTKKAAKDVNYLPKQAQLLASAYTSSLELIVDGKKHLQSVSPLITAPQPLRTIAFPSISTGIYNFPLKEAAMIAVKAAKDFIEKNPNALDEVRFVFLDLSATEKTATYYVNALNQI